MRRILPEQIENVQLDPIDTATLNAARSIVDGVRLRGEAALREYAEQFGDIVPGGSLVVGRAALHRALEEVPSSARGVLTRVSERIAAFARSQKEALSDVRVEVPGGSAGHTILPMQRAGCYAPGGRYPLPSTVLMTAVTARIAGVREVWVASPNPSPITLAACAVAGADALLSVGGAQAIAAFAFGAGEVPACDVVVGPGNRYVSAAKQLVSGHVAIDMLAGPSELVVLADSSADAATIAADLLAQAEHDVDALPVLVTCDRALADAVDEAIETQLRDLPTAATAKASLARGFIVLAASLDEAVASCNKLAPEHLELQVADPEALLPHIKHCGALFVGAGAAEVFADYGVGPNHVLPTGRRARYVGGLSVFTFLRVRTWLRMNELPSSLIADVAELARYEGLEAHARAAERRLRGPRE